MATETQNGSTYSIKEAGTFGDIQIADEVIAIIAGLAATEVEGVAKMYGNITNELVSKLGMNRLSKGVKVLVTPNDVKVDLSIELKYGYSVMKVSEKVQEAIGNDEKKAVLLLAAFMDGLRSLADGDVWFMIHERYGRYQIGLYYDNLHNQAHGEDL